MTSRILPLDKFVFSNFTLPHLATLTTPPIIPGATFTPTEEWETLPPGTLPPSYTEGQTSGQKYAVIKGHVNNNPTQIYLGTQNLYYPAKYEDVDHWEYPHPAPRDATFVLAYSPVHHFYVEVDLPHTVPHVRIHPKPNFKTLTTGANIELEGNFHKYFTIETTEHNQVSAYQLLPPDTMAQILDKGLDIGLEYVGKKLYIKLPLKQPWRINGDTLKFNKTWEETITEISNVISLIPELVDSSRTAVIPDEELELIEQEWNVSSNPEEAKRKAKKLEIIASIIALTLAGGVGAAMVYLSVNFKNLFT